MHINQKVMTDLNQQMAEIFSNNSDNKPRIIQQLFNLLPLHQDDKKKVIQTAILYSMQNIHEWENIINYIDKWQMDDFRHAVIDRMRLRLQENYSTAPIENQQQQLKRLVQKYWRTCSPKKNENRYKEPINIKGLFNKNLRKSEAQSSLINAGRFSNFQIKPLNQNLQNNSQNLTEQSNQFLKNTQSEEDSSQYRKKIDPYSTLTGRPAILKKTSFFDQRYQRELVQEKEKLIQNQKKKDQKNTNNQQQGLNRKSTHDNINQSKVKSSNNEQKQISISNQYKTNRKSQHIIPQRTSQQIEDASPNFNQVEIQSLKNVNEPFPRVQQQFNFGSIKKTKDASLKHLTISPNRKLPIGPKILKINKAEDQPKYERQSITKSQKMDISFGDDTDYFEKEKLSQFSFIAKEKNIQHIPQVKESQTKNFSQKVSQKTITQSQQNQDIINLPNTREENHYSQISFEDFKKDKYTPFFNNNEEEFLNKETLKYIDKIAGSGFSHNDLLKKMGMNIFSIFDRMLESSK